MSIAKIFGFGSKNLRFDSQNYNSIPFNGSLFDIYAKYGIPKPVETPQKTNNSKDAPAVKYGIPKPPKKDEFVPNDKNSQNPELLSNQEKIKYSVPDEKSV